jgi:hypothetical protein
MIFLGFQSSLSMNPKKETVNFTTISYRPRNFFKRLHEPRHELIITYYLGFTEEMLRYVLKKFGEFVSISGIQSENT